MQILKKRVKSSAGPASIRPMHEKDIGQVLAIENMTQASPWSAEHFKQSLLQNNHACFVLEVENVVIGYAVVMWVLEQAELLTISVQRLKQRSHHGTMLMDYMIQYLLGVKARVFHLEVRESNQAAIAFYRKQGFAVVGRRKKYYSDNQEDALLMSLKLGLRNKRH